MAITKQEIISQGLNLADQLATMQTLDDLDALIAPLDAFSDQLDANFGTPATDGELETSLSASLAVAVDWQKSRLERPDDPDTQRLAQRYLEDFKTALESGNWR